MQEYSNHNTLDLSRIREPTHRSKSHPTSNVYLTEDFFRQCAYVSGCTDTPSYMNLLAGSDSGPPVSTVHSQLATQGTGRTFVGGGGTERNRFEDNSGTSWRRSLHKALTHGRRLIRKREGSAIEPSKVLFLTVNLTLIHSPSSLSNTLLKRFLVGSEQSSSLDQGDGGSSWGGNGDRNSRVRDDGAGDGNPYSAPGEWYILWGLYTSVVWIFLRCLALHLAIREPTTTSMGQYVVSVLWLGLMWCLVTWLVWAARLPFQLLCKYSPECVTARIPLFSEFSRFRLHESMSKHFGLVPNFVLSWFLVSDLLCVLKQVAGQRSIKASKGRGNSKGHLKGTCKKRAGSLDK